jgi:serine/threonine protein kinase
MLPHKPVTNLVTFYGSWKHGNIYNVLLEYANGGNLLKFFQTVPAPTKAIEISQFWERLFGVIEALVAIHQTVDDTMPAVISKG